MPEQDKVPQQINIDHVPTGEIWEFVYSKELGLILGKDKYEGHSTICDRIKWNSVVVGGHIIKNPDGSISVDRYNTQSITEGRTSYVSQTKYPTEIVFKQISRNFPHINEVDDVYSKAHRENGTNYSRANNGNRSGD